MPSSLVPKKFKAGHLHSGSKSGPIVKDRKQMVAIMLSERGKEQAGLSEDENSTFKRRPRPTRRKA